MTTPQHDKITTGNFILKNEGFHKYDMIRSKAHAEEPKEKTFSLHAYAPRYITPPPMPSNKRITVLYNHGKCYKCDSTDFELLHVYFAGSMGKCKKCNSNFVISSDMSETDYEKMFGLRSTVPDNNPNKPTFQ